MSEGPDGDENGEPRRTGRSRLLRVARMVYLTVLGALVAWLVVDRWDDIRRLVSGTRPGWLVLAGALALGQVVPGILLWAEGLRRLVPEGAPPPRAVVRATLRSLPARYLPGSIWYALGRATILRTEHGVRRSALATVALIETMLVVVVAIASGTLLLGIAGRGPQQPVLLAGGFVLLLVGGSPPVLNRVLAFVARRRGAEAIRLAWRDWGRLVALIGLHWVWSTTTFTVFLHAFPHVTTAGVVEVAGAFLVAWAIGWLALFAPQGAGVFEATVAALIVGGAGAAGGMSGGAGGAAGSAVGAAPAAIVVGGYRALMLLRDAVLFGAEAVTRRGVARRGSVEAPRNQGERESSGGRGESGR